MKKTLINLLTIVCWSCMGMETPQPQQATPEHRGPTRIICDPTYDITFKSLFNETEEADGVNGKQRAISLLNGLLDLGIVDIKFLPTSQDADYTKTVIFDVLCECTCRKGNVEYVIDVEIQKANQTFYFDRSVFYGSKTLVERSNIGQKYSDIPSAIVISFLDFKSTDHVEGGFCGRLMKTPISIKEIQTIKVYELSNKIQLYYFQLPQIAAELQMQNSETNTSFTSLGKSWLSLLSYKYNPNAYTNNGEVILSANDFNISEINSAISVLESFKNGDRRDLFLAEKSARDLALRTYNQNIEDAKKEGEAKAKSELQPQIDKLQEDKLKLLTQKDYKRYKRKGLDNCKLSRSVKKYKTDCKSDDFKNFVMNVVSKFKHDEPKTKEPFITYITGDSNVESTDDSSVE